jgi:hypothetical protein
VCAPSLSTGAAAKVTLGILRAPFLLKRIS